MLSKSFLLKAASSSTSPSRPLPSPSPPTSITGGSGGLPPATTSVGGSGGLCPPASVSPALPTIPPRTPPIACKPTRARARCSVVRTGVVVVLVYSPCTLRGDCTWTVCLILHGRFACSSKAASPSDRSDRSPRSEKTGEGEASRPSPVGSFAWRTVSTAQPTDPFAQGRFAASTGRLSFCTGTVSLSGEEPFPSGRDTFLFCRGSGPSGEGQSGGDPTCRRFSDRSAGSLGSDRETARNRQPRA